MATRKIILLLLAAVIALGTVFLVHGMLTPEAVKPAEQQPVAPITEIAAAARDLPTGTILKESDLKWIQWPAGADTDALLVKGKTTLADAAGAVVRDGFRSGEPIISARIAHPKDQGFLAAVLTPGMRAMSVSLTPTAEVAGFIFPGDRVDVILTHSFSRKDSPDLTERRVSETILQNVRVLALDQRSDNQSTDPKIAQIATLEVGEKQAEKLALAIDMTAGSSANKAALSLVLRSLASDDKSLADKKPEPTWDSDVSSAYPTVNGSDGLIQRVQVMRGKTITEDTFERHR
ncbi:MAG: Flp pilus assembly protein CpaB [Alphaproteobacteria bacterium]|nr:Flp pilus assembly protein CpaB [Alphaproteobacteria bacterium]